MNWWRRLLKRDQLERELEAELQFHLEQRVRDNLRRGLSEEEAHRNARIELGGLERLKEECRDQRGTRWIEDTWQDLRYAARLIAKDRSFAFVAVLTLALGIGANTAMFSVIHSVLVTPLPFHHPERMVWVAERNITADANLTIVFGNDLHAWRARAKSFDGLSVLLVGDAMTDGPEATQVRVACLSDSLTRIFGVAPILGRDFRPEEFEHAPRAPGLRASGTADTPTGVALLSDRLFRRLGGDPDILGEPILIGRTSYTVVGILPSTFRLPVAPSLQLGIGPQTDVDVVVNTTVDETYRGPGAVIARLKPGVQVDGAFAELDGIRRVENLSRATDERSTDLTLEVTSLHDHVVSGTRRLLLTLWASAGFVLLVACVNIVSLLLARSVARRQEIAVRTALGAGRWRLVRQMVVENGMLALGGGLAGVALADVIVNVVAQTNAIDVPRLQDTTVNWTVLMFSGAVCVVSGGILCVVPALTPGPIMTEALKSERRTTAGSSRVLRSHSALVVLELSLAVIPLTGAALMARSLWEVRSEGALLAPDRVLMARIESSSPQDLTTSAEKLLDSDRLIAELESLPGVRAAALWSMTFGYPVRVSGTPEAEDETVAMWLGVSSHYPEASGVRVVEGRWFSHRDRAVSPPTIVVSERLARRFAPDRTKLDSLVGRTMPGPFPRPGSSESEAPMTIIGVVSDFRSGGPGVLKPDAVDPVPQVFFPDGLRPMSAGELLVRTSADPLAFVASIRRIVESRPATRLLAVRTLDDQLSTALAPRRAHTSLILGFAGIALLLAMIGMYGVVSYAVAQRTHEIGLRLALGARQADVLRMVLIRAARLVIVGAALGLAGSASLTHLIRSLLYGVDPADFIAYVAVCLLLTAVALVATYLPARRAVRVDPMEALRYE